MRGQSSTLPPSCQTASAAGATPLLSRRGRQRECGATRAATHHVVSWLLDGIADHFGPPDISGSDPKATLSGITRTAYFASAQCQNDERSLSRRTFHRARLLEHPQDQPVQK